MTLLLTGVAYPLLITGISQALFPDGANGSLITDDSGKGRTLGLLGEPPVNVLLLNLALDRQFGRLPASP